jgi:radical SAM protein with 4Fe4S-binding SPASM domain
MRFHKTYIEISNICNLQCTFCPEVDRPKKILSPEQFAIILKQVLPHTDQITLHLMGEPLSHPDFLKILKICDELGAKVNLTTNGTLLQKYRFEDFFNSTSLRQINFSLHSFTDNFPNEDIRSYLYDILAFSKEASLVKPEMYINYRLWNISNTEDDELKNKKIIDYVCEYFQVPINEKIDVAFKKSKNITGRIYFHFDSRFRWPSPLDPEIGDKGFCHALSQQIGIHADGTVIPCCLDKEANIPLGNILNENFQDILQKKRLTEMRDGFKNHLLTEELCKKCTYIKRFQNKLNSKNK